MSWPVPWRGSPAVATVYFGGCHWGLTSSARVVADKLPALRIARP
jgi:hypothetical protein